MRILKINGCKRRVYAPDEMPLLWVLRDRLALTGTKYGCGIAVCGACTVHVNGQSTRACSIALRDVGQSPVVTIEGVTGRVAEAVISAWERLDVAQCGYCQPGQIMSAVGLLTANPRPTDEDVDAAMTGNVCRCAAYLRIRHAIRSASDALQR